ncbi:hypothetical protein ACFWGM_28830 [Streptomyces roseolus]|uniref:hypothetical protein n=1 Tax=Streptomyces roseolus TaxID=67358 RepID=UPI003632BDD1
MRNSAVLAGRRGVWCALSCAVPSAAPPLASAAAPPAPGEAARVPFATRHRAEPHRGTVRAATTPAKGTGGTGGRLGGIAHDGVRGTSGDYPEVRTSRQESSSISDSTNSENGRPNSGVTEFGRARSARFPAAGNTPGHDPGAFDLRGAPRNGADRVHVRLGSREDTVWLGAPFPRADVRR